MVLSPFVTTSMTLFAVAYSIANVGIAMVIIPFTVMLIRVMWKVKGLASKAPHGIPASHPMAPLHR